MISVRAIITYIIVLGMFPIVLEDFLEDFEVLLTVHLSVILVINKLNAQNIFYNKFIICLYMFRKLYCSPSGGQIVLYSILCRHTVGGRPVHRTATYRVWWYQMLYNTIWPNDDEHNSARNM